MTKAELAWTVLVSCFLITILFASIYFLAIGEKNWEQFKSANNCKKVAHIKGDVFNTYGTDSKGNFSVGVGSTPDKTGWLCDDGVTYYR